MILDDQDSGQQPERFVTVELVIRAKVPVSQASSFAQNAVNTWEFDSAKEWEITRRIVPKKKS